MQHKKLDTSSTTLFKTKCHLRFYQKNVLYTSSLYLGDCYFPISYLLSLKFTIPH